MTRVDSATVLLAGGRADPNLDSLAAAAARAGVDVQDGRFDHGWSPSFSWDLDGNSARLNGRCLRPIAAFVRYDVFSAMRDVRGVMSSRAAAWYQGIVGWLLANDEVRIFNRAIQPAASNKPSQLRVASAVGLRVPRTWITNAHDDVQEGTGSKVVKPVAGGDHCRHLDEVLSETELRDGNAAMPAIVQTRLAAPEIRIYVIGEAALAFELRSSSLDYREKQDVEVHNIAPPTHELGRLRVLMDRLGMDFGAADFKSDPETGELVFLELNTSPMFARFDAESGGALSDAMVAHLCGRVI